MVTPVGDDLATLRTAAGWQQAGHRVAIATVIETWGSAPRRRGSILVIRDDGLFEGSVSGGCVEGDVITEARALLAEGTPARRLDYGVADETAWQVGLACGGRISVLVQPLADTGFPITVIDRLSAAAAAGDDVTLAIDLASGVTRTDSTGELLFHWPPPRRLAIIGAVHIAQALVPLAQGLGIAVTVIDPRGLFAADARFAGLDLDRRWPDEALAEWRPNAASAVVALTHDPKLDDVALAAALDSPAFYIAALGSRKNHARRCERLATMGYDTAALARIHGPAGLDIGAADPAEIALSIAAQLTASWRAVHPGKVAAAAA
ncbi:XdhC family protein [Polymorphobacter fuscus]|uniref:XshC-Cox1-family protein n=1 Tax=Sandarakinorhabdus fusca TaxID=1439888 RepID=A0A7C9KWG2_9SPHN|nr:XdhC family protein [Polymorphobacter fuscus]KAB7649018.1 XdhC family protein [Polymorphobacter fuscus]MQT16622.1 XshC-Cox1-family protein [Polymorphobacter fuscus]NJC07088.1 xanthine dehydrogenase accessory factor [Polymorphobacter fuscus]